ncbi:carbohydrate ABC transporter, N-acetylglucosamine/diacetylchitobiose-binding protein [Actinorhabdospora filicis]|uniref:Carbohydrate ABC transporter, N-acetylglucosamine/diacetylchitobiose-binding protein n=1 Tax=Actinorhabdospora filicis TaxID=1785913 RepID=A0A9W6SM57_9ACTN|nr:N-acetylglucosamine/diacetylchitobiose ABC transporter substrate-binding protein [Actinorhabdospora filicis]GLZ78783.1 carbohydrate ABC transporter, N-acetylglucosamine/diacetylchitobiose-binding protein [Actinorhabdospora filicis]
MATETTPNESGEVSRRSVLKTSAALGMAVPAAGFLAACAGGGSDDKDGVAADNTNAENPFKVDGKKPLEVVVFKGGYGDDYAIAQEALYKAKFPESAIKHAGITDIRAEIGPRFQSKTPPDVLDNSGAQQINHADLANNGQYADLTPLLDAPSIDDPAKKVRDTLLGGVVELGTYNGKFNVLNYGFTLYAIWYSGSLFKEKGWTEPKTWTEMLALCEKIKAAGIAPWTYTGVHPYYLFDVLFTLAARHGGNDVVKNIDNLEANAWKHPSIKLALEAMVSLKTKGYILDGSEGLDHRQSQARFIKKDAAFIPVGSWLENEEKDLLAADPGFDLKCMIVPALDGSTNPNAVWAAPGEGFAVPQDAKNREGGMEYLRIMLSAKGREAFSAKTSSLTVVAGKSEGMPDTPGVRAVQEALKTTASAAYPFKFDEWYANASKGIIRPKLGEVMAGRLSPDEFITIAQKAADDIKADSSIQKQHRN